MPVSFGVRVCVWAGQEGEGGANPQEHKVKPAPTLPC